MSNLILKSPDHFEALQQVYGLPDKPLYGHTPKIEVPTGDIWDSPTGLSLQPPTLMNLMLMRGEHLKTVDLLQTFRQLPGAERLWKDHFPPYLKALVLASLRDRYADGEIKAFREYLMHKMHPRWLYCIQTTTIERHAVTGELFLQTSGEKVLTLLPKQVQTALVDGCSEQDLRYLAPLILSTLRLRISRKLITTLPELNVEQGGWFSVLEDICHAKALVAATRDLLRLPPKQLGEKSA